MLPIAVIAHKKKVLGGGLKELRQRLEGYGYDKPLWFEASSSREAAKCARKAVAQGATLLLIWGGDGTVQRCVNAVVDADVEIAILPAGTANLLATNLEIPLTLKGSLDVALEGTPRRLDVGVMNGKCFTVMAGIGFDAIMMQKADGKLKERFGRLAYLWTGLKATRVNARYAEVRVIGQMNQLAGGIAAFPSGEPDDGVLEVGVVTAQNARQWGRVAARLVAGNAQLSPFTQMTQGRDIEVTLDKASPYELDGGARKSRHHHAISVRPSAVSIKVPLSPDHE
jgi:diacylglycerol kinase family enzyme